MKTITIQVTNEDARVWAWVLRKEYSKDKRTGLDKLCEIAVRRAVVNALEHDLKDSMGNIEGEQQ